MYFYKYFWSLNNARWSLHTNPYNISVLQQRFLLVSLGCLWGPIQTSVIFEPTVVTQHLTYTILPLNDLVTQHLTHVVMFIIAYCIPRWRCKMNSKLDFKGKKQGFDGKKPNWNALWTNMSRFSLVFSSTSMFSVKHFCSQNFSPKFDNLAIAKSVKTD